MLEVYPYRRDNLIEREKLVVNRLVSGVQRPESVVDAFAGDGTSSRIYARHAERLIAIEKDLSLAVMSRHANGNHSVVVADNRHILPSLPCGSFDLVDLDPCGSAYEQLRMSAYLLGEDAILMLSSGEIQSIVRGFRLNRFPRSRSYAGRKAVDWTEEVWIPEVLAHCRAEGRELRVVHFFTSPVLSRAVLATHRAQLKSSDFATRPKYLGWFSKYRCRTEQTDRESWAFSR